MAAARPAGGSVVSRQRPPGWLFLGLGAAFFGLNHLIVVLGWGMSPEFLVAGAWLVVMGGWVRLAGRTFDAVNRWADPSGRRMLGLVAFTMVAALGLAEAVAWWGYGQHLV